MRTLFFFSAIALAACDHFELSPNQAFDVDSPSGLNAKNLELIQSVPTDDTVTIAFVGDSQRFYDNVDKFVDKVNSMPEIDFIFLAGDISDFGLLNEFEWIHRSFSKINKPYLGVIGNHDLIANGENVFRHMFGELNYSFVYDSIKFVVHNTNGREYPHKKVPDIAWLTHEFRDETSPHVKYFVGVSHVPPMNGDFNRELVQPYTELLRTTPGFLLSLHGHIHQHTDGYPYHDGVRYITSFAFNKTSFVVIKIIGGKVLTSVIEY